MHSKESGSVGEIRRREWGLVAEKCKWQSNNYLPMPINMNGPKSYLNQKSAPISRHHHVKAQSSNPTYLKLWRLWRGWSAGSGRLSQNTCKIQCRLKKSSWTSGMIPNAYCGCLFALSPRFHLGWCRHSCRALCTRWLRWVFHSSRQDTRGSFSVREMPPDFYLVPLIRQLDMKDSSLKKWRMEICSSSQWLEIWILSQCVTANYILIIDSEGQTDRAKNMYTKL